MRFMLRFHYAKSDVAHHKFLLNLLLILIRLLLLLEVSIYNVRMKLQSSHLLPYENKWVALEKTKVVASGTTIQQVQRKLEKEKNKKAVLLWVLPFNTSFSPDANQ